MAGLFPDSPHALQGEKGAVGTDPSGRDERPAPTETAFGEARALCAVAVTRVTAFFRAAPAEQSKCATPSFLTCKAGQRRPSKAALRAEAEAH